MNAFIVTQLRRIFRGFIWVLAGFFLGLPAPMRAQTADNLTNGLVAYYPFDGSAMDASGHGFDGVVCQAALTADRFGHAKSAYRFNGANSYIGFAQAPTADSGTWSIAAWVRPDSLDQLGMAVYVGCDDGVTLDGYGFGMGNQREAAGDQLLALFGLGDVQGGANAGYRFASTSDWHQVVMTYSQTNLQLYVDGAPVFSSQDSLPNVATGFRIGSQMGLRYFRGAVDEVRLYTRVLAGDEVQQLFALESWGTPAITAQPRDLAACLTTPAAFQVSAWSATPVGYQWYVNNALLPDETNSSLAIAQCDAKMDGSQYFAVIANSAGATTSRVAVLSVTPIPLPVFTLQPVSSNTFVGGAAEFVVSASSPVAVSYQWYLADQPVADATNQTLALSGVTTNQFGPYYAVAANGGGAVTSQVATLTVMPFQNHGLMAYYSFSGNALDQSGHKFNGSVVGATLIKDRYEIANRAYRFDGTNNYISFTNVPVTQTDNWSISIWMRPSMLNRSGIAVALGSFGYTGGDGASISMGIPSYPVAGNQLYSRVGSTSTFDSGYAFTETNFWHHVVLLREAGVLKFFVDGIQTSNTSTATVVSPTGFWIGSGTNMDYFAGAVDDVRLYNRPLSADEVQQLYALESQSKPIILTQPLDLMVAAGYEAVLKLEAWGGAPMACQWYENNLPVDGGTNLTLRIPACQVAQNGNNYFAVLSNSFGVTTGQVAGLTVSPDGLVAYYPFDGDTKDASGYGIDGLMSGPHPGTDRFGTANRAHVFNYDTINFNRVPLRQTDNWTLSAWMRPAALSQSAIAVDMGTESGGGSGFGFGMNGFWLAALYSGVAWYDGNYLFTSTNEWHYVAVVREAGVLSFYVDGVQTASTVTPEPMMPMEFHIGSAGAGSKSFKGALDDVRIYSRPLSAAEIQAQYAADVPTATAPSILRQPQNPVANVGLNAGLDVQVTGSLPLSWQWYTNDVAVAKGTNSTLTVSKCSLAQNGMTSYVVISNAFGSVTSDVAVLTVNAASTTHYVWGENPTPVFPYTNWDTAASTIQDAVDAALAGDVVLVTNGIYASGGRLASFGNSSNRVSIERKLTVSSVNGPGATWIVGAADASGSNGPSAIRCVYLGASSVLNGFTLTNGHTANIIGTNENCGGGAYCETNTVVNNCIFVSNTAALFGGGAFMGQNLQSDYGFGALNNCLFYRNSVGGYVGTGLGAGGGGVWGGRLNTCTVAYNSVGGVFYYAYLTNCIVYYNSGNNYSGLSAVTYSCVSPTATGTGNTNAAPLFVNSTNGDFRLQIASPCIDAGLNSGSGRVAGLDLDGNPGRVGPNVDMGAYEFQYGDVPVVALQPTNRSVAMSNNASFTASFRCTSPVTYQWYKDDEAWADGGNVYGWQTLTLQLTNVGLSNAGSYYIVASNAYGTAASTSAVLTVLYKPSIITQPADQATMVNSNALFAVQVWSPDPPTYQWYLKGLAIAGETNSTLALSNCQPQQTGNGYSVIVTDNGGSVTSRVATLTVTNNFNIASLKAFYPFNGNANDFSGNGYNGTAVGATLALDRFNRTNAAYNFNGSNQYISFSAPAGAQVANWTLCAWVRLDSLNQTSAIVMLGNGNSSSVVGTGFGFGIGGGTAAKGGKGLYGLIGNGSSIGFSWANSGYAFDATNVWHQVVMQRDTSTIRFYVDGVQTGQTSSLTPSLPTSFRIGSAASDLYFAGGIDEVRWYNRALSQTEIQALYAFETLSLPVISRQPQPFVSLPGSNATFQVSAWGNAPLSYQWYENGAPVPDATNASLSVANCQLSQNSNSYFVVVTNDLGSVTSRSALLTVTNAFEQHGLVGYYAFNGNYLDGSVYGNHGHYNISGAFGIDHASLSNRAARFNGSNWVSFSTVPLAQADSWTLAAWLRPASLRQQGMAMLVGTYDGTNGTGFGFGLSAGATGAGNRLFGMLGGVGLVDGGFSFVSTNEWHQIVMLYAGGTLSFYIDGVRATSLATLAPLAPAEFRVGSATGCQYYQGMVDEARVYNRALSPAEVQQLFWLETQTAPAISAQPQNQMVLAGDQAVFSVGLWGLAPLSCQWFENNQPIAAGASGTLVLSNCQVSQNGNTYYAVLSNALGTVASKSVNLTVLAAGTGATYYFRTLAGMADQSGSADGLGAEARFNQPSGLAVDFAGNLYVADQLNHTIRKLATNGLVTTIAGVAGAFGTNDGTGSAARFYNPNSVALDAAGRLFVTDTTSRRIRRLSPIGDNWVVASQTSAGGQFPCGLGVFGTTNIYIADRGNESVLWLTTGENSDTFAGYPGSAGSLDGLGQAAKFDRPQGLAVDSSGSLFVTDMSKHTVRKISPSRVVTTVAGIPGSTGSADGIGESATFNQPWGIAVDSVGNLFVADQGNNTIRKISPDGVVTTIGGFAGEAGHVDGAGSKARFNQPCGIACDAAGRIYVSDASSTIMVGIPMGAWASPAVTLQPAGQTNLLGAPAVFNVLCSGSATLAYQWQNEKPGQPGVWFNLDGATNSQFALAPSQPGDQGNYRCLVSNDYGSVASQTANLALRLPPLQTRTLSPAEGFGLGLLSSEENYLYRLEFKTNLQDQVWQPAGEWQPGTGTNLGLSDLAATNATRFYRLEATNRW